MAKKFLLKHREIKDLLFIKNAKSLESTGSFNEFDHIAARKMDGVASNTLESSSRLPATAKEPSTF